MNKPRYEVRMLFPVPEGQLYARSDELTRIQECQTLAEADEWAELASDDENVIVDIFDRVTRKTVRPKWARLVPLFK